MREFITRGLIDHAAHLAEGRDPEVRVALIGSHLVGLLFARDLLGIELLARVDIDAVAIVAPAIQQYIDA